MCDADWPIVSPFASLIGSSLFCFYFNRDNAAHVTMPYESVNLVEWADSKVWTSNISLSLAHPVAVMFYLINWSYES